MILTELCCVRVLFLRLHQLQQFFRFIGRLGCCWRAIYRSLLQTLLLYMNSVNNIKDTHWTSGSMHVRPCMIPKLDLLKMCQHATEHVFATMTNACSQFKFSFVFDNWFSLEYWDRMYKKDLVLIQGKKIYLCRKCHIIVAITSFIWVKLYVSELSASLLLYPNSNYYYNWAD
jgi:hypothetical protein